MTSLGNSGLELVEEQPIQITVSRGFGDRVYRSTSYGAAGVTLGLMVLIGGFLLYRSLDAFRSQGWGFFTETAWNPSPAGGKFGIAALLLGTAVIAVVALLMAVPTAIGTALFITEYAPRRIRKALTSLIDLLAAVPSLIYGIWGASILQGKVVYVSRFLSDHFGWIGIGWFHPLRATAIDGSNTTTLGDFSASAFLAAIVVALMILPICTAVMREVFAQAPPGEKEGALALGGTRWGVIRDVVLPFGKGGIIGGSMLGLGRALGETVAVALIISRTTDVKNLLQLLKTGGNSIAAVITRTWSESSPGVMTSSLMAAGLVLFAVTLAVNAAASYVVSNSRSGSSTEI